MNSFQVGSIQVQVIYDGLLREDPDWFFIDHPTHEWHAEAGVGPEGVNKLGVQCLLVRSGDKLALLDTGLGTDPASPASEWIVGERGLLMRELAQLGIGAEQIDAVVLTHGHSDHLGGNVLADNSPAFPRARYYLAASDYAHFTDEANIGGPAGGSAFHVQQLAPLREQNRLELTDGEQEVIPGVRILPAPGHTPGHICVGIASGGEFGLFVGDLMHHPIQVSHPDWSPHFDWMPLMSAASRQTLLDRARAERSRVFTSHFPFPGVGHAAAGWSPTSE